MQVSLSRRPPTANGPWTIVALGVVALLLSVSAWWTVASLQGRADELRAAQGDLGRAHALVAEAVTLEVVSRVSPASEQTVLNAAQEANARQFDEVVSALRSSVGAAEIDPLEEQSRRFLDAMAAASDDDIRSPLSSGRYLSWSQLGEQFAGARRHVSAVADTAVTRAQVGTAVILGLCGLLLSLLAFRIRTSRRRIAESSGQALSDPLTGLPNRRAFDQRILAAVQEAERTSAEVSLVLLDVDRFKRVNDLSGHAAGDAVLVEVSRRIANIARTVDTVARLGSDEFAWLLPGADPVRAWEAADRARRTIGEAMAAKGGVTISLGVCSLSDAGTATELVRCADRALYDAKRRGRDTAVSFVPERTHTPSAEDERYLGGRDSA